MPGTAQLAHASSHPHHVHPGMASAHAEIGPLRATRSPKHLLATLLLALAPVAHAAADPQLLQADELARRGEYTQARAIFSSLAAKGDAEAMHQLGIDYAKGRGVAVDNAKALQWFSRAAMRGNARAMTKLALMHLEGRGTPKNAAEGISWLQRAAEHEEPNAHYLLSQAYLLGRDVPSDLQQAYIHMALAQRNRHPAATPAATDALSKMLSRAQRRAADIVIDKRTPEEFRRQMQLRSSVTTPVTRPR